MSGTQVSFTGAIPIRSAEGRINELLASTNALLERARRAEARMRVLEDRLDFASLCPQCGRRVKVPTGD